MHDCRVLTSCVVYKHAFVYGTERNLTCTNQIIVAAAAVRAVVYVCCQLHASTVVDARLLLIMANNRRGYHSGAVRTVS